MPWGIIGIIIGIVIGSTLNYTIPTELIKYTAVMIVGILDSLFGAMKTELTGHKDDRYNTIIFLSGLLSNIILALGITFLGEKLGLDLYLAVTVVFIFRIFKNLGLTRRAVLEKLIKK